MAIGRVTCERLVPRPSRWCTQNPRAEVDARCRGALAARPIARSACAAHLCFGDGRVDLHGIRRHRPPSALADKPRRQPAHQREHQITAPTTTRFRGPRAPAPAPGPRIHARAHRAAAAAPYPTPMHQRGTRLAAAHRRAASPAALVRDDQHRGVRQPTRRPRLPSPTTCSPVTTRRAPNLAIQQHPAGPDRLRPGRPDPRLCAPSMRTSANRSPFVAHRQRSLAGRGLGDGQAATAASPSQRRSTASTAR